MDKVTAISKVKLLYRLAASAPEHEAANANDKAKELIEKFELLPEDYEEKVEKPVYTDDDLLFQSKDIVDWKRIVALTTSTKFDCFIIQEEQIASTGDKSHKYFIYGDPDDVAIARHLFNFVCIEIDKLIAKNCYGRGELYVSSYAEGMANGVKTNIEYEDYHVEGLVKPAIAEGGEELVPTEALAKPDEKVKEEPLQNKIPVNNKQKPLDIIAYFRGESDGRHIHIGKLNREAMANDSAFDLLDVNTFPPETLKKLFE